MKWNWGVAALAWALVATGCDDSGARDPADGMVELGPDSGDDAAMVVPDSGPMPDRDTGPRLDPDAGRPEVDAGQRPNPDVGVPAEPPNLLLIIADDLGVDWSPCYAAEDLPALPTIEAMCARGLVFESAWANPVCSPTRATLLTGRYAFRTGVGGIVTNRSVGISPEERSLPQALGALGYRSALVGKWHLGAGVDGPNLLGFEHYAGLLRGALQDYSAWDRTVNGVTAESQTYATTAQVDDALAWLGGVDSPWFLQLAFIAPHRPFHAPPAALHRIELSDTPTDAELFGAMLQSMDTEMGRLLEGVDLERTVVVFMGDNGTDRDVARTDANRSKSSLYQGGVHVPMVIAGPGVASGRVPVIVNASDLFATFVELAGGDEGALDSVSMVPYLRDPSVAARREYVRSDQFNEMPRAIDGRTIRDARYKLIDFAMSDPVLFDLLADPVESTPLDPAIDPAAQAAYDRLAAALDAQERTE